jgi:hypothetical protein
MIKSNILGTIETEYFEKVSIYNKVEDNDTVEVTLNCTDCCGDNTLIQLDKNQAKDLLNMLQNAIYWSEE